VSDQRLRVLLEKSRDGFAVDAGRLNVERGEARTHGEVELGRGDEQWIVGRRPARPAFS